MGGPKARGVWVSPTPQLLYGEVKGWAETAGVQCVRIPGYWIHDENLRVDVGTRPNEHEKVLYHLHGGYYSTFSAHPEDAVAKIPRGILKHSKYTMRTFSVEYRRTSGPWDAPVNPFPTALLDAIAGYYYLVHDVGFSPENIVVVGDSAGGNLALALVRYIQEAHDAKIHQALQMPSKLILLSPWVDMSVRGYEPNSSAYTNISSDFIDVTAPLHSLTIRRFVGSLGRNFAETNRYLSPGSESPSAEPVSFEGFPRTIIISGGAETFLDQIRSFDLKMSRTMGDDVRYYEFPDAVHNFIAVPAHERERDEALGILGKWVDAV